MSPSYTTPDPALFAVARGDAPADFRIVNARIVNVFTREIIPGEVLVHDGRIASVLHDGEQEYPQAAETIDLEGRCLAPGFIDAHMHIESTMMPPSVFATVALPHATTGVIADPHEIANVLGIDGIRWMMRDAEGVPMDIRFGASSCVPSCHLEHSGATLTSDDLAPLFDEERIVALAEMMNFPGAALADPEVLAKIKLGLEKRIVDGHAPGLSGRMLQAYAATGISSDHECTTIEEAREKLRLGMRVYIREGSAARNLEALLPLVTEANAHRFCFCTDDRHPADLRDDGHIDHVVRLAIARGLNPATAIAMATIHVADHYRLTHTGAIAPGRDANFFTFDDPKDLRPDRVFYRGAEVARAGRYSGPMRPLAASPRDTVKLPKDLNEASFRIPAKRDGAVLRVIRMHPHQLVTGEARMPARIEGGAYVSDVERDILKICVIERHNATGAIGRAFVTGFQLKRGAIASTVGHDAHNLAVVGTNDRDMLLAARELERIGGGQCAVADGTVLAALPLPIAGLMSDQPSETIIAQQEKLLEATRQLGCPHHDPYMPLSFLPLPVIPALKVSDLGLVDVTAFAVVGLEAE